MRAGRRAVAWRRCWRRCWARSARWLVAADVLAAWRERDALQGRPIGWEGGGGTAAGIDDSGALLVDTAEGRVALQAGEVHLIL